EHRVVAMLRRDLGDLRGGGARLGGDRRAVRADQDGERRGDRGEGETRSTQGRMCMDRHAEPPDFDATPTSTGCLPADASGVPRYINPRRGRPEVRER